MSSFSEKFQFLEEFTGRSVKVTLTGTQVVGVIQRATQDRTLVLDNVCEIKSGKTFPGLKHFFGHEILNVEILISANDVTTVLNEKETVQKQDSRRRFLPGDQRKEDSVNYVVIDNLHEKFGPAINHIHGQKVVGIGLEMFGTAEPQMICWLQVATKKVVYLFDILTLGRRAFKNGLCLILENKNLLKVVHNCRRLVWCLKSQYDVNVTNVFDTQVADVMLFINETGGFLPDRLCSFQEVVRLHYAQNTNLISLHARESLSKADPRMWSMRPCPPELLQTMAKCVSHLLPLRLVLLDALLSDFTTLVDAFMSSNLEQPCTSDLDVPAETQEVLLLRKERRALATQSYRVKEDGSLQRSSFRTAEPHAPTGS